MEKLTYTAPEMEVLPLDESDIVLISTFDENHDIKGPHW